MSFDISVVFSTRSGWKRPVMGREDVGHGHKSGGLLLCMRQGQLCWFPIASLLCLVASLVRASGSCGWRRGVVIPSALTINLIRQGTRRASGFVSSWAGTKRSLAPLSGSVMGENVFRLRTLSSSSSPEGLPISKTGFGPREENALIVLNTDCVQTPLFRRFWSISGLRICADGGANQLYDGLDPSERTRFVPDYIKGDLDSVRPDVTKYYEALGTQIIRDPDQDTNDLEKCLEVVKAGGGGKVVGVPGSCNVFVVGALGLRFDHAIANVHMLFKYGHDFRRLILLGSESMAFLLQPGFHVIRPDVEIEGPICGLLPLAGKCRSATTTGLRWNLEQQPLELGGLISSSNEFAPPSPSASGQGVREVVVTVENSDPLLWTTAIKDAWQKARDPLSPPRPS